MEERERDVIRDTTQERDFPCPIGQFFYQMDKLLGPKSDFRKHLYNSKVEFLKAIRSVIDKKIEDLEKRVQGTKKQAVKVEVE